MDGIKIKFSDDKALKEIKRMSKKANKKMDQMMGEFKERVPTWVTAGIMKDYNISKSDIAEKSKLRISGSTLGDLEFKYTGRLLSPASFDMSPKAPKPGGYTIKAKIKNKGKKPTIGVVKKLSKRQLIQRGKNSATGTRKSRKSPPMLQTTGTKRADGVSHIPFQRTSPGGSTSGGPMSKKITTVSVPQMIKDGKGNLKPGVEDKVLRNIEKRFWHYTDRMFW